MTHRREKKEPKKCREWEKIRRDKLNTGFTALSKLLPNHDPSLTWSKVDILQKASQYIEELQGKLNNVLTPEGVNKTKGCEIKMLYGRVKKLLLRNEQLSNLLKDAGIKIPSSYGNIKNFREPLRWANKITPEQAKEFQKKEMEKENKEVVKIKKKRNLKKATSVAEKHKKKVNGKIKKAEKTPPMISLQLSNVVTLATPQVLPKVSNQPCFIITKKSTPDLPVALQQNGKTKAATIVTNSSSLSTPKMASVIKPPTTTTLSKVSAQTLNTLGPGTLILANGNIVPILPPSTVLPPPTILTNPTPIIIKPPSTSTTLIVMPPSTSINQTPKPVTTTTNCVTIHPRIRPKINITRTTQSNKVPIPAIARYKESTDKPTQKKKEVEVNTNKRTKRKANSSAQNKKPKLTPTTNKLPLAASEENKENAVKNPELSKNETEKVQEKSDVNKEKVPVEVSLPVSETVDSSDQTKSKEQEKPSNSENLEPAMSSQNDIAAVNQAVENLPHGTTTEPERPADTTTKPQEPEKMSPPTTTANELSVNLNHSELSNDLFSTLQVPIGGQNPESTSPTAAFLLAFPLVSSLTGVKVTEVIEEENSDSRHGTPTLLQIGTMDTTKTTQSIHADSLTPNLLNLDNFSFFSGNNFYPSFDSGPVVDNVKTSSACAKVTEIPTSTKIVEVASCSSQVVSTNPPIYTTEQQTIPKPSVSMVSNTFTQQITTSTYSKTSLPPIVTSTYLHNTVPTNNCPTSRKPTDSQYNPVSIAQCNAFNPFSDFSKANSYSSFSKSYNDPLYTNSSYSYQNENNFNQNAYYPPKSSKPNNVYNSNYTESSYNVNDTRKRHVSYYNQTKTQTKPSTKSTKTNNQPKPPINWMTTPDFRSQPSSGDYLVPPIDYNPNTFYSSNSTHTTYFNTTSSMYPTGEFQNTIGDNRKTFDSSLPILQSNSSQRNEFEENQFSWSPTKLPQFLETPHTFVSSTLPTLVGDLALGTTQAQFGEQKADQSKAKETNRRSKVHSVTYDNQSNFLSVSQLVENKTDVSSTRATNRRNSGNRTVKSNSQKKSSKTESKELMDGGTIAMDKKQNINYGMSHVENSWMTDCNKPNRHAHKNPQSSYSAEALIGHQDHTDTVLPKQRYRQQSSYPATNKALPIPTFLSDNIVPYFPPVEIPQDNNFMQPNSNYQSFNTSVQNNSYVSTGPTITSSYLQPSGLIPEFQNYPSMISDDKLDSKHCSRSEPIKQTTASNRTEDRLHISHQVNTDCATASNNFIKKSKTKQPNEPNLPGIVDFGFLSMPSTINSPILPDDFHSHSNFLPPPTPSQLYPCKNPLYAKQSSELLPLPPVPVSRSGTQNFDGSTSVTGNVGTSLTSFNLSAIFPEINKGSMPLPGLYPDPSKNKNYNFQRNYIGSSVQVFSKSTSSTSYVNSLSTSYAPSN